MQLEKRSNRKTLKNNIALKAERQKRNITKKMH